MMKIAFIYPRFTGPFGGERLLTSLAKEIAANDNEVTIYASLNNTEVSSFGLDNVRVIDTSRFNWGGHQLKNILDFFKMPFIAYRISKEYDYVVGTGWQTAFCLYVLIKFRKFDKNRTVYYCLEPPRFLYDLKEENKANIFVKTFSSPVFALIKKLDVISVKSIKRNSAISDWTASQMKKIYGVNASIIYPGVEVERFRNKSKVLSRKKLGLNSTQPIFITVSKLHPRKKIPESVNIYLKNKTKNSKYFIIGDGPDKENILNFIKRKNDPSIHMLGKLSDKDVDNYMTSADYFIFTAVNEPFGIAPLEAEVAGCKVLPKKLKYKINSWKDVSSEFLGFLTDN